MDTGPEDAKARLKRIDVLFRNFMNEFHSHFGQISKPTRRSAMTGTVMSIGIILGLFSSSACVIVPVPGESDVGRTGRVSVGLGIVLMSVVYVRAMILNAMSASLRWRKIVKIH